MPDITTLSFLNCGRWVNKELSAFSGFQNSESTATLDMDATLVSTNKIDALSVTKDTRHISL
jgi:hypothetical protein